MRDDPVYAVKELDAFYKICDELFMMWSAYRVLFDDNVEKEAFEDYPGVTTLKFINFCMIDYILLQLSKLHDPEKMKKDYNLSLDYILNKLPFSDAARDRMRGLKADMQMLAEQVKSARHKVLAHHDLGVAMSGVSLGEFEKDSDIRYFLSLQQFIDEAFVDLTGKPRQFNQSLYADAKKLWVALVKGWEMS